MKTDTLSFATANGPTTAYVAIPDSGASDSAVILIQEWWGLNDHIRDVASRFAGEDFTCIAPDLYRGKVTKDPQEASQLMHGLAIDDGIDTIRCAIDEARRVYGTLKFAITGFCMGGTFALQAACDIDGLCAAAPFYGDIASDESLAKLKTPTLFINGVRDQWISVEKVDGLKRAASRFGLPVEVGTYDADHAFFNDTRPDVYNSAAASDAWTRVLKLFREKCGG